MRPTTPLDQVPEQALEDAVEKAAQDDPEAYARCCSGLVPGDWVPYGSTQAQLPSTICDCVYEGARAHVEEQIQEGELVLTTSGQLVEAAGVPLKSIVTPADVQEDACENND